MLTLTKPITINEQQTVTVSDDVLSHVKVPTRMVVSHPTRRFKDAHLTIDQQALFQQSLNNLTSLRKFAIHYLECTFGKKHLLADFPDTQMGKASLATKIAGYWFNAVFYHNEYAGHRWNKKLTGIHSLSAQRNLIELISNFAMYRNELKQSLLHGSLIDRKRYFYNQKGNNPKHHKAVHASSLSFKKDARTIRFPTAGSMKPYVQIISNHYIKLPDYGTIFVKENLKSIRNKDVKMIALVRQNNGRIDVHITFERRLLRKQQNLRINGFDWNLTNHQPYTDIYNQGKPIPDTVIQRLTALDQQTDYYRMKLSYAKHHTAKNSQVQQRIRHLLNKVTAKKANVMDNYYITFVNSIAQSNDYLAVESLNYNQMVQERASKNQNKANHRAMIIKPGRLHELLLQAFNRQGHTLVDVDCCKTSQNIYGSDYVYEKHSTLDRKWFSTTENRIVIRDQNAACNILYWSVFPEQHAKVHDRDLVNAKRIHDGKKPLPDIPVTLLRTFN